MKIWVDADACPVVIKEILFRAAERTGVRVTLVANQPVRIPASSHIEFVQVSPGFDVADNEIVKRAESGDLVITSDIPLAAEVIEKGADFGFRGVAKASTHPATRISENGNDRNAGFAEWDRGGRQIEPVQPRFGVALQQTVTRGVEVFQQDFAERDAGQRQEQRDEEAGHPAKRWA